MPAIRNLRTARDENCPCELSSDTKLERPEPKNNTWPRPDNRKTALAEFTKRCPEERCKACCSSRYPGLYYSHCPLCKYDATDAEDYTRHLQDHIEDTRFFVERKNANGKIERIAYYRCILQNCQRKDGKRHVGRQARNLAGHATTFIGNCPHKCHYCDDRFSDQSPRSKHERAQHSQLPEYIAKKAAYEAAKAAARANGQDFVNDETYEEEKQKTRKKRGSPKRANKDEVFASVPQSVRRTKSADRQPVAGPSFGSPSRLFAPHPSRSSRGYNTASSAPVAGVSHTSLHSYEFCSFNENYLSSSISPTMAPSNPLAGAASEPLVNPANDDWPSSCPPEDADLYLHNPYAFSFPQTPMPSFNESFDPTFFAPPVPDSLIDPELLNAPQPYPQPAVQFPIYDAPSHSMDPISMAYLTDPSFAAAQQQWSVSPWDVYNFNNLPQSF